jgi:hypothetical protein
MGFYEDDRIRRKNAKFNTNHATDLFNNLRAIGLENKEIKTFAELMLNSNIIDFKSNSYRNNIFNAIIKMSEIEDENKT